MHSILNNPQWAIPAAIVLLGLFVYGLRDLLKFSIKRAWAISGVCFDESIRRRVLWITPLAIVGVVLVTQFQRPSDEQDAIRQTTKFALFACGLVVTVTAVILACTNLPKEIETRVIYTIVTKPTTRLEIVVGKVIGFAKVSLAILIIMGLFTLGYLHLQSWRFERNISARLASGTVDPVSRATYEYWAAEGLLGARTYAAPESMEVFSREPKPDDTKRWFFGNGEGGIVVPFQITADQLTPKGIPDAKPGSEGVIVRLVLGFDRSKYNPQPANRSILPVGVAAPTTERTGPPADAAVDVSILDQNLNMLIDSRQIIQNNQVLKLIDPNARQALLIPIPPQSAAMLDQVPGFFVQVIGLSSGVEYSVDVSGDANPLRDPVCLITPGPTREDTQIIGPARDPQFSEYRPAPPTFRARNGLYGQQLRGGDPSESPVSVMRFRGVPTPTGEDSVGFEMHLGIERGPDEEQDQSDATQVQIIAQDRHSGRKTDPIYVYPENNRTTYFKLPADVLRSGDFDLYIRNLTDQHFLGLQPNGIAMVASQENFNINLIKSLSILWMLSILVVIVSIFCSTFLSWPIAVVLTLVILLGHWGVVQLGESLEPGIGNSVAQDIFGSSNPGQAKVVSASVEAMSKMLIKFSDILPDISQFSAIQDIEQGITISATELISAVAVLATFGVPMIVLSYVLLRNKEVAP